MVPRSRGAKKEKNKHTEKSGKAPEIGEKVRGETQEAPRNRTRGQTNVWSGREEKRKKTQNSHPAGVGKKKPTDHVRGKRVTAVEGYVNDIKNHQLGQKRPPHRVNPQKAERDGPNGFLGLDLLKKERTEGRLGRKITAENPNPKTIEGGRLRMNDRKKYPSLDRKKKKRGKGMNQKLQWRKKSGEKNEPNAQSPLTINAMKRRW